MEIIKNINKLFLFNRDIYLESPMFITCDKYWDGGIKTDSSLKEKSDFYLLSAKMSNIIKDIMLTLDESVFIGESLCEYEDLYEKHKAILTELTLSDYSKDIRARILREFGAEVQELITLCFQF